MISGKHFSYCKFVWLLAAFSSACFGKPHPKGNEIAAKLQPFVESHALAGAVTLVASKEKILDEETVGFADVAATKPMRKDTLFWIASESKPMTSAALMMLVDEGKVNVDDPVEKYLHEFKGQMLAMEQDADHTVLRKPTHPITVREVLSHTSGLPFSSPMEKPTLDGLRLRDAVASYAMAPLEFQPGTKYQYSNAGINTAGRIIEVVSGRPYERFMDERLFKPLGMRDTTFWPSEKQLKRLARSYKPNADKSGLEETTVTQLTYPLNGSGRQPMPAGGLFSTAEDVARFCQMVLNGGLAHGKRYLSEVAVEQMTSKQTGSEIKDGYGFGWSVGNGLFGHGGAFATNMTVDRNRGLILIYMVQHSGFPKDGAKAFDLFKEVAIEEFGGAAKN